MGSISVHRRQMIRDTLYCLSRLIHFATSGPISLSSFHHLFLRILWSMRILNVGTVLLFPIKPLQTHFALKSSIFSIVMLAHCMRFHYRFATKPLLAIWTLEPLLLQMDHDHMMLHRSSFRKPHPAVQTLKGLLSVMHSLMTRQHRFLIKSLRAVRTLKVADLQMVPFNVPFQSTSRYKRPSIRSIWTLLANKSLLDTVFVVHVTPKPSVIMEHFAANFTFNAQLISMQFHGRCDLSLFGAL